jgi:hypothetical protein
MFVTLLLSHNKVDLGLIMSILLAADDAIESRLLIHDLCIEIENADLDKGLKSQLLESCYLLYDRVEAIVNELETALVPPKGSVGITFFPFGEKNDKIINVDDEDDSDPYGYNVPRRSGELHGTIMLPSSDPNDVKYQE